MITFKNLRHILVGVALDIGLAGKFLGSTDQKVDMQPVADLLYRHVQLYRLVLGVGLDHISASRLRSGLQNLRFTLSSDTYPELRGLLHSHHRQETRYT